MYNSEEKGGHTVECSDDVQSPDAEPDVEQDYIPEDDDMEEGFDEEREVGRKELFKTSNFNNIFF